MTTMTSESERISLSTIRDSGNWRIGHFSLSLFLLAGSELDSLPGRRHGWTMNVDLKPTAIFRDALRRCLERGVIGGSVSSRLARVHPIGLHWRYHFGGETV